jgi:hypothetical protein
MVEAFSSIAGVWREIGLGVCSLIAVSVISVKDVSCRDAGSGDSEGSGVGRGGCSSGVSGRIETLLFRAALASFTDRRFGAAFLEGDDNGSGATLSGGLKTCEGSTDSLARGRLAVLALGVAATVLRRGDARVILGGAGVNSSSSLSSLTMLFSTSLSSSSTTTFLRDAVRREGRSGDAADIATVILSITSCEC